jgi:hypothetical protein
VEGEERGEGREDEEEEKEREGQTMMQTSDKAEEG